MSKRPAVILVGVIATTLGYLAARFVPISGIDPNWEWLFVMAIVALIGGALISDEEKPNG